MPEKPMKVGEISKQLGVDPNTIRNWCRRYARYLSPGANPPSGKDRAFTMRDLNALTFVRTALEDGLNHDELSLQLGEKTFSADGVDVIVGLTEVVEESPQNAQEGRSDDFPLMVALSSMEKRQDATDKRVDVLQQSIALLQQERGTRLSWMATGLILGVAVTIIAVAFLLHYAG